MKICIIPVCFNAFDDALRLLASIDNAYSLVTGVSLKVILSDNSTLVSFHVFDNSAYGFEFAHLKNNNIGYFPAFAKALSIASSSPDDFDYVIVCNVDLIISDNFFKILSEYRAEPKIGVIAPGIYSERDDRNLNPKINKRPSFLKLKLMYFICSSQIFFNSYRKMSRVREIIRAMTLRNSKNKLINTKVKKSSMYGAHGSFLIFTRQYFLNGARIDYPRFLFGEEVFVGEQVRINGLSIEHVPNLKVFDKEHASTSKMNLNFLRGEHKKTYDYLCSNYFL